MSLNTFKYILCYVAIGCIFMGMMSCKKKEDAPTYAPQVSTGAAVSYTKFTVEDKQFVLINVNGVNQIMEWSEKGSKH